MKGAPPLAKRILLILSLSLVLLPGIGLAQQVGQEQEPVLIINDDASSQSDPSQAVNAFQDPADAAAAIQSLQAGDPSDSQPIDLSGNSSPPVAATPTAVPARHTARVYGPITNEDHIWSLAQKLRPNTRVTLQQMVIALQRANPAAFSQANINGLKNGTMLRVPSPETIQAIPVKLAVDLVRQQNEQWQQLKKPHAKTQPLPPKPLAKIAALVPAPVLQQVSQANIAVALPMPDKNPSPAAVNTKTNIVMAKVSSNVPVEVKTLQQQLLATQSELLSYKQQNDAKVDTLEKQNALIASQMLLFNERLSTLKNDLTIKINAIDKNANLPASPFGYLPQSKVAWWILLGAVFLIVLLWMPSAKKEQQKNKERKNKERQEPIVSDPELGGEYDFMNSKEAIPAKLDLARAYINMDDFLSAQQVLKEVIKKGDQTERQQAEQLLGAIRT